MLENSSVRYFTLTMILAVALCSSGCFWDSDNDNNYFVRINNNTDQDITVEYNLNKKLFDLQYEKFEKQVINPGKSSDIYVKDQFYDANIIIEYNSIRKEFDINPNFWGEEIINVIISDFASST